MGFFGSDDDDVPNIQMTEYSPIKANAEFPAVNFLKIFDDITGEEFSFMKGRDGSRYLQIKDEINRLKLADHALTHIDAGNPHVQKQISELETELKHAGEANDFNNEHGLAAGEVRIGTKNRYNRLPIDLPQVSAQQSLQLREAAGVANVTAKLREIGQTLETIENSDPTLVKQNQGLLNAYKEASQRSIDRGFDIKRSGLDEKLKTMGLDKSSSALSTIIDLQKEQVTAEVNNHLETYKLAHGMKQSSIDNYYKMGQQTVQEGSIELNKFQVESGNELVGREQDLKHEGLKQDRAYKVQAMRLQQEEQRNPMRLALPFITSNNQQSLGAINSDNQAMHNVQSNELQKSQLELERYKLDQMSKSNPFEQMLMGGVGAGVGALAGGLGGNIADKWIKPTSRQITGR